MRLNRLINLVYPKRFGERTNLDRQEVVALLKELSDNELVSPFMVVIQQRTPGTCQLQIKGNYEQSQIEIILKNRCFSYEANKDNLIIFKPQQDTSFLP
jgi:hypothetical protein